MAHFAGVLQCDGGDLSEAAVASLARSCAASNAWSTSRAPAEIHVTKRQRIALLTLRRVADYSQMAGNALAAGDETLIAWDGRLHNRQDLLLQLSVHGPAHLTDADIARQVYARWGTNGFAKLVGDWSLAIWDPAARAIVLARDFAGNRSVFFSIDDHRLVWSTSLETLLQLTGDVTPSARFIAGYLTATVCPGVTPYAHISLVKPAHAFTCTNNGIARERRLWDIGVGHIRYRDRREYAVALRELFFDAVQARLEPSGVWAELSGGLDSSTIVCVADHLRRLHGSHELLNTISCQAQEGPDERAFIRAVEAQCRSRRMSYR